MRDVCALQSALLTAIGGNVRTRLLRLVRAQSALPVARRLENPNEAHETTTAIDCVRGIAQAVTDGNRDAVLAFIFADVVCACGELGSM
jgi:hypothetical protein